MCFFQQYYRCIVCVRVGIHTMDDNSSAPERKKAKPNQLLQHFHPSLHVRLELCLERLALSPQLYSPFLRLHGKPNVANLLRKHTLDP